MKNMHTYMKQHLFQCSPYRLFSVLERIHNLELFTPPWEVHPRKIISRTTCKDTFTSNETERNLVFTNWETKRKITPDTSNKSSLLHVNVTYNLRGESITNWIPQILVRKIDERIARSATYQECIITYLLELQKRLDSLQEGRSTNRRILISGASGFLGKALVDVIKFLGFTPIQLVRRAPQNDLEFFWDPHRFIHPNVEELGTIDDIICLSGAPIGQKRWTQTRKKELLQSRLSPVQTLSLLAKKLSPPPKTFVVASGINIYETSQNEIIDDESTHFSPKFLGHVAQEIEEAIFHQPNIPSHTKKVVLRCAPIIGLRGGLLGKIYTIFTLGFGGRWGSGKQWMSWISLEDAISSILHTILSPNIHGTVNITSPNPITVDHFTTTLSSIIGKPAIYTTPLPALYLLFGQELVDNIFLESHQVYPSKLLESGFYFHYPTIRESLNHTLGINNK